MTAEELDVLLEETRRKLKMKREGVIMWMLLLKNCLLTTLFIVYIIGHCVEIPFQI